MTVWIIAALVALPGILACFRIEAMHNHLVEHIDRQVAHLRKVIIVSTQDAINAITDQLVKAQREIVARIADVQAQLEAAGVAEQVDLSSLTAAAQALDDVVPDAEPTVDPEPVA
jgi:uncharacterized protein YPO0396